VGGVTETCQVDDGDEQVPDNACLQVEPEYCDLCM
jgi:hypothetical protein